MKKNIAIVHYNTPYLTKILVDSINYHTPGTNIIIFENSDKDLFSESYDNVTIIDNTKQQVVNFEATINKCNLKRTQQDTNFGGAKHAMSVDWLLKNIGEPFVLFDSDCILKKDITDLYNCDYAAIGMLEKPIFAQNKVRLCPYICFFNTELLKGINYFDKYRNIDLCRFYDGDTGASFLEDVRLHNLPIKEIDVFEYIEHLGGGSWRNYDKKDIEAFVHQFLK